MPHVIKGIHMSHNQFRDVDRRALDWANPVFGMVVALDDDLDRVMQTVTNPPLYSDSPRMWETLNWFAVVHGTEIFTRIYPTPGPVSGPSPVGAGYAQMTPTQVVDEVVRIRNTYGPNFRRIIPGNEPNTEWPGVNGDVTREYHDSQGNPVSWSSQWHAGKWRAMNAYYLEVFNELQNRIALGTAPADIELYYPAMAQAAGAEGVANFCDDGTVVRQNLDDGAIGYDHLRGSIETFWRFTWHNYFYSWHAFEGAVSRYFPQWLIDDLYFHGAPIPSRITECGWYPGDRGEPRNRDSGAGNYRQYTCADAMPPIGSVTGPDGGTNGEGTYPEDLAWFFANGRDGANAPAGGIAVWLLSSTDAAFEQEVGLRRVPTGTGTRYEDHERPWFASYRTMTPP